MSSINEKTQSLIDTQNERIYIYIYIYIERERERERNRSINIIGKYDITKEK